MKSFYEVWGPDGPMYYQESRKRGATHMALAMVAEHDEAPIEYEDRQRLIRLKLLDEKFDLLVELGLITERNFYAGKS